MHVYAPTSWNFIFPQLVRAGISHQKKALLKFDDLKVAQYLDLRLKKKLN